MKLLTSILCALSILLVWSPSYAYTLDDLTLPEVVPATAERPELTLNGASLRELYMLVKSYVGALYLEETSSDPITILNSDTHKSMVFYVRMKHVSARRIGNALREALILNLTQKEHEDLSKESEQMLSYFTGRMYAGEKATFDYIPGKGTRITINNQVKGIIPGKAYFRSMLSMWIGDHSVGRDFKEGILGANMKQRTAQVVDNHVL